MKIRIWQIQEDLDRERVRFEGLDHLRKKGDKLVDSRPYAMVFDGTVKEKSLEGVFSRFNSGRNPRNYFARSLSVSDVVEVVESDELKAGFYFCDRFGFQPVEFDPSAAEGEFLRIILIEPQKKPVVAYIPRVLEMYQMIVGGRVQGVASWFRPDPVMLCCNDDGKLKDLPYNRLICRYGRPIDFVVGTVFLVGIEADEEGDQRFGSVREDLVDKYMKKFDKESVEL